MHSSPLTSPTTMRSGLIRSAFLTNDLMVISPVPSIEAGRASSLTTFGCESNLSSAESSIVTILSDFEISHESAFKSVVLPDPVPPTTAIPCLHFTAQDKNLASH